MESQIVEVELKNNLKRKYENATNEEEKSIMLIYHRGAQAIECHCGETINGRHNCLKEKVEAVKKLQVIECRFNTLGYKIDTKCCFCEKDAKEKQFINQWRVDDDGYCRCTECGDKCDDELPKDCSCTWYYDMEGVARCKECNVTIDTEYCTCDNL